MQTASPPISAIHLPLGLIGMSDLKRFELVSETDALPFQILRSLDSEPIEFVVIDPRGVLPDYAVEIADDDAEELRLSSADDPTLVLNIVTIRSREPQQVTANLVAPIVVNRGSGTGRQVVLANHDRYSTTHPLIGGDDASAIQPPC